MGELETCFASAAELKERQPRCAPTSLSRQRCVRRAAVATQERPPLAYRLIHLVPDHECSPVLPFFSTVKRLELRHSDRLSSAAPNTSGRLASTFQWPPWRRQPGSFTPLLPPPCPRASCLPPYRACSPSRFGASLASCPLSRALQSTRAGMILRICGA